MLVLQRIGVLTLRSSTAQYINLGSDRNNETEHLAQFILQRPLSNTLGLAYV